MKKISNRCFALLAAVLLLFSLPACAQLVVGRDYAVIDPPLLTDSPGKIEVVEFFSYGCPHCSELQSLLGPWVAKQPSDVVFKKMPVGFNPYYQNLARLYYALEVTGELGRLDSAVFAAIHEKGLKLIDEKSFVEWVGTQGVDARKFSAAYSAFGVLSKATRANQLAQAAKIRGVPALIVDGRYLVVGQDTKTLAEMLALTDKIIDKARTDRQPLAQPTSAQKK